jgi:hypothetical protein
MQNKNLINYQNKKNYVLLAFSLGVLAAQAQKYNNILNYSYDGTPTNG